MHPFPGDEAFSVAVRDPVWGHVWLTPELFEITQTESFSRLYRIKQLGPTEYLYPGASHTRAAHSIGVYHLAHRIISILSHRGASEWMTQTGKASFLAAALLHDIGHFPFTHSLKELPLRDHESLSAELLTQDSLARAIAEAGGDPAMTAAIIDHSLDAGSNDEVLFFRNLLSGVLDPDKLDYLNRDAASCGVPYGIQDTDFVLSRIMPDKRRGIVLDSRALMSVESILFSKYLMYRSVYWHKTVRIATAMMKKSLYVALGTSLIKPEDLYSQDDGSLYRLIRSLPFPESTLASMVQGRQFYQTRGDFTFDDAIPGMVSLENLEKRSDAEALIAEKLSALTGTAVPPWHVIIDIPERISFESDLFITDEGTTFSESSTVFTPKLVRGFTETLRRVRIALHPETLGKLGNLPLLSEKLANWAGL